jgi:hypothetical protein
VRELRYRTVHEDLIAALPELRRPYQRLFDDWDDFGGEPPGQYLVFPDTLGRVLEIALTLEDGTPGRAELLRRALSFAEMLFGDDSELQSLVIDAVADTLDGHPAGREAAARFGGPRLNAWFARYSRDDWKRPPADQIIDLWGVRAELDALLPATPLAEIPGISHPADYLALDSVQAARAFDDGAVLLSTFGTTRLYAVVRAADVAIGDAGLDRAARDIAAFLGGEDPQGNPGLRVRRIPRGERVWNMDTGAERHTRLHAGPWVADALAELRPALLAYITGQAAQLDLRPSGRG